MKTRLELPFPPSVNGLYATDFKTKRRFKTKEYKDWEELAGYALLDGRGLHCNNTHRKHRHKTKVVVTYSFTRPDKRARDVFNYEKAVSDFLVLQGILEDDKQIERGTCQWSLGMGGVTVVIEDLEYYMAEI